MKKMIVLYANHVICATVERAARASSGVMYRIHNPKLQPAITNRSNPETIGFAIFISRCHYCFDGTKTRQVEYRELALLLRRTPSSSIFGKISHPRWHEQENPATLYELAGLLYEFYIKMHHSRYHLHKTLVHVLLYTTHSHPLVYRTTHTLFPHHS